MNNPPPRSILHGPRLAGLLSAAVLFPLAMKADVVYPGWWTHRGILATPSGLIDNRAPANIGQAKWMVKGALEEIGSIAPGLADDIRADLVGAGKPIATLDVPVSPDAAWHNSQRAPLLVGQLKAIAKPFYDHMGEAAPYYLGNMLRDAGTANEEVLESLDYGMNFEEIDLDLLLPWSETVAGDDNNKGIANLGQLKALFHLDFHASPDLDGQPDLFEGYYFGTTRGNIPVYGSTWDSDGDGILDIDEVLAQPDPALRDLDGDGVSDLQEMQEGTDPLYPEDADTDGDGLIDYVETGGGVFYADYDIGTDPADSDSDGDGLHDGWEFRHMSAEKDRLYPGLNWFDFMLDPDDWAIFPTQDDSDGDTIPDNLEDPDGDGLANGGEFTYGGNPYKADTDMDGLSDSQEVTMGFSLTNPDTDGDGIWDIDEINSDPNPPLPPPEDPHGASNPFRHVKVEGGGEKGVPVEIERDIPLPPFSAPRLAVVLAFSQEYPQYTGQSSKWDDALVWSVTSTGLNKGGQIKVNGYHDKWAYEEVDVSDFEGVPTGYGPAALLETFVVPGTHEEGATISVKCHATNVEDENLGSALYIGFFPIEVLGEDGLPLRHVKIANMDDPGAVDDFSLHPELSRHNFRVNLKGSEKISLFPPGSGYFRPEIEIETTDAEEVAGHAYDHTDAPNAVALGEVEDLGQRTTKSILVADTYDDAAGNWLDEGIEDDTHIAQIGGNLHIKSITVYDKKLDVGHKLAIKRRAQVHLTVHILQDSSGAPVYGRNQVENRLIQAREIFNQAGVWLTWTINLSIPPPYGIGLADGLDPSGSLFANEPNGPYPFAEDWYEFQRLFRGVDRDYPGSGDPVVHDYGTLEETMDLNVFYVNFIEDNDPNTITRGMCWWPADRGIYRNNIVISAAAADACTLAHEIGHAIMQFGHDEAPGGWDKSLMWSPSSVNDQVVNGEKRIRQGLEDAIMSAGLVEPYPED